MYSTFTIEADHFRRTAKIGAIIHKYYQRKRVYFVFHRMSLAQANDAFQCETCYILSVMQ